MKFTAPVFTKSGFYLSVDSHDYYFGLWWQITSVFLCEILFSLKSEKSRLFGAISRELTYEVSKGSL